MYTEEQLLAQLRAMGICSTDTVTIHISLKTVGELDTSRKTGAEVVIDALRAAVCDGLLLIPSHTYSNIREVPVYDVRRTEPCIGAVPRVAVQYANRAYDRGDRTIVRSLHPDHSMVAFGQKAQEYTADDAFVTSPMAENGGYRKLCRVGAKILLIGVGMTNNTLLHAVDEYMEGGNCNPSYPVTVIDYDGTSVLREARNARGGSAGFGRYLPAIEAAGAVTYGKLGEADVMVCDAKKMFDAAAAVWPEFNRR